MTETIALRKAGAQDADALALVGAATFLETYAGLIPGPDIVAHCATWHAASVYRDWLAGPRGTAWLAETRTGGPVGYLVLTPASLPDDYPHPGDLEVQRIYVLSRFQGAGVGPRLMASAIAHARAACARQLVLGVLKTNSRAVAFYERQGFEVIGARQFTVGKSVFDDLVLRRVC